MNYKHLFGPVPSRRLGISLGIDLIPHKTCSLDCIYCECGKTTDLTLKRKEYIPTEKVISELENYLNNQPELDYITFSGSGEPTLHKDITIITDYLKNNFPEYKIALLTNGCLFTEKKLIEGVKDIDLIIPSLDSALETSFQKINRPAKGLKVKDVISALINLSNNFRNQIWLEVFIVPGINDSKQEIEELNRVITQIKPDRVQLNSLDRPGTENWVQKPTPEMLESIAEKLSGNTEIIAKFKSRKNVKSFNNEIKQNILNTLKRRPCTEGDLCEILNIHYNEVCKYIQVLLEEKKIQSETGPRGTFYKPVQ